MNSQRAGIFTSLVIHSGIILLLLGIPTIKILPELQTIRIAFEHPPGLPVSDQNGIKPATAPDNVHRLRISQPKLGYMPVAEQRESISQVAGNEHDTHAATNPVPSDDGNFKVMSSQGMENIALSAARYQGSGNINGNMGQEKNTDSQNTVAANLGMIGAPSFLHREMPIYPLLARSLRKEGKVVLKLLIDAMGRLQRVEVIEKGEYGFTEAAIEAVKKSTYIPALRNGEKVTSRALLPVRFKLQ